jgi:multiple sugar transport system substrate-binding protein
MAHFTPIAKGNGDPRNDASAKIEDEFKQKFPNITIKWQQTAWPTIGEKFMASWSANTAPDICLFSPANVTPVFQLGALQDLLPILKQWPDADQKDFPKAWWDTGTYGSQKVIAPLLLFGDVMVYRKSVLSKASIDATTLKSWDKWVAALQQITVDGAGKHGGEPGFNPASVNMWGFGTFMALNSGATPPYWNTLIVEKTGHQDVEPPTWKADSWVSDAGISTMQYVADWVKKYQIQSTSTLNLDLGNSMKTFAQGQCAVYDFGTNVYASAQTSFQFPKDDVVTTLIPNVDGSKWGPMFLNHWSIGVSNKSKALDTAYTVLTQWMTPSADLIMADVGGQQPKRLSTAQNALFASPDRAFIKQIADAEQNWGLPDLSPPVRTSELLTQAYQGIVTQNVPVKQALTDAKAQYDKLLAEIPADKLPKE